MFKNPSKRIHLSLLKGQKPVGLLQDYSGWSSDVDPGTLSLSTLHRPHFVLIMIVTNMLETNTINSCTFYPEPFFCALRSPVTLSWTWWWMRGFLQLWDKRPFKLTGWESGWNLVAEVRVLSWNSGFHTGVFQDSLWQNAECCLAIIQHDNSDYDQI